MNYIKHSANGKQVLIIQMPKIAERFIVRYDTEIGDYIEYFISPGKVGYQMQLAPANYRILFIADTATEEQASEVVDEVIYDLPPSPSNDFCGDWNTGYRDYDDANMSEDDLMGLMAEYPFVRDAKCSLQSLIRANFPDHANYHHLIVEILN